MKNLKNYYPVISIVVPTYNNESELRTFLKHLYRQEYPRKKMEVIISDGGSTDNTVEIAKNLKVDKVFFNVDRQAEHGIDLGMRESKGELITILAVDNFFKKKSSLQIIANVFQDKSIFAAFPKHESKKNFSLFSKYVNRFTDPFTHFVYGSAANARTFHKIYSLERRTAVFDVYDFKSSSVFPLIALAQGFTLRNSLNQRKDEVPDDITPVHRIIKEGKKIAYLHSVDLFHETISDWKQFMRKQRWATHTTFNNESRGIFHRKKYLSNFQKIKIALWPIYCLTIIPALLHSVVNTFLDRELLWLLHPYVAFLSVIASIQEIFFVKTGIRKGISRK